jgi:starch-binding outer membrane protein, SusD/RagB family
MNKFKYILSVLIVALVLVSCEDYLKETPPSELSPETFLATQAGVEALLDASYLDYKFGYGFHADVSQNYEYSCDIMLQVGGGMNLFFVTNSNFQWTASNCTATDNVWTPKYRVVRNTNIVIDNINNIADETLRAELLAEARYLRAVSYFYLYDAFGPVPLRTSSLDPPAMARASDAEIKTFIIDELNAAVSDLPAPGTESNVGRATKGAALAYLTRFYMLTKDWPNAAATAKRVMDLNYYELFPSYRDLFKVENEHDKNVNQKEMIAVSPCTNVGFGNKISACTMPPNFAYTEKIPEFLASGIANWASNFRFYDSFIASFDKVNDKRYELIFDSYIDKNGNPQSLTIIPNNLRTLKYFDNTATAADHGNDFPLMRYADVLLMRAEALNEVSGPNTENIGLINQVRTRAGLVDLSADDFSKETLRDYILEDRGREFYYEGLRRSDLIRHGKFISQAHARGVMVASDFHMRYPIPQGEMDANDLMEQNPGY